jgi:aryl-alcohol dehydrogenase-like predicted oxidoreductase
MRYRLLGKSGLRVSEISLGTMTFGEEWGWGTAKEEARRIYDAYREAGGNFIDTANLYTGGTSETFVGEFMSGHREQVVLATKYSNAVPGNDANAAGNHRKNMMQSVEASLKRLGTDYIDLYWMHIWDKMTPVDEVMRAFDDLVRQGKVLYIGASDAPAWWVAQANTLADLRGWSSFAGIQIEYSLLERTVERELLPMAKALGITVTAWSPLKGGILSGKYNPAADAKPGQNGAGAGDGRYASEMMAGFRPPEEQQRRVVSALREVSVETARPLAQVALAWLRYRDVPVIPILGARKIAQLEDNLASLTLELSTAQVAALDRASKIELGFPQNFYENELARTFAYGGMRDRILA